MLMTRLCKGFANSAASFGFSSNGCFLAKYKVIVIDLESRFSMLVPLGVIEDVVPWHMVVDHRHTVVVPNKGSHRCRRPGVSVEIGWSSH